ICPQSGVGKSTLIKSIFGTSIDPTDYKPGRADIQQEFCSAENPFLVLHGSEGFEPGDLTNFETVRKFIQQRLQQDLPLSERIHGLWYVNFFFVVRRCLFHHHQALYRDTHGWKSCTRERRRGATPICT
ncbi:hypothetical protein EDB84DRAFT_1273827, partial [Lactarius hengduanensis]